VSRPTEKRPIRGQNSISKTAKTLRRFIIPPRAAKAQIFMAAVNKLTLNFLQVYPAIIASTPEQQLKQ
jgi:hypothetical protein